MARVTYNPNTNIISAQIMRRGGDVDGAILQRANRVQQFAVAEVEASTGNKPNSRPTGRLAGSIHVERTRAERGRFGFGYKVVADARYAAAVHGGSRAHRVYPQPGLSFYWQGKQFTASAKFISAVPGKPKSFKWKGYVSIPQRDGNPFLSRALRKGAR